MFRLSRTPLFFGILAGFRYNHPTYKAEFLLSLFSYDTIKKVLFKCDPESAHALAGFGFSILEKCPIIRKITSKCFTYEDAILSQELFGTLFKNPIGLGAGFDKNAQYIKAIQTLGFGYTEIGTITPKPQSGNAKPRLFRLIKERSLQNAMGFNNDGMDVIAKRVAKYDNFAFPIGINIGKNKVTPEDKALNDYGVLLENLSTFGHYVVINISSPNTPGLRDLQNETFVTSLFTMAKKITTKPILLKIAPDMSEQDALGLCKLALDAGASGIVATNTTIDYSLSSEAKDFGGISGELLKEKSRLLFKAIGKEFYDKTLLISVGGIDSAEEAYERIKDGASLVQIYTAFIYKGPFLCKNINTELAGLLKADKYTNISQAVGAHWKK
jgi:dihydroorotate dehydrogenase